MEQKQKIRGWRLARVILALVLGLLLLAVHLPNTGGVIAGPAHNGMWRCGPFLFYPLAVLFVVGTVAVSTGCILFGVARNRVIEMVGWVLVGLLFASTFLG
jgi:hypothetical protein